MKQLHIYNDLSYKDKENVKNNIHYFKLFVDGASRNNPGLAGIGVYLLKDNQPIEKRGFFVGIKTNNQAEYLALLLGLFYVKKYAGPSDIVLIISDSELLIKHLTGEYKVRKPELKILYNTGQSLLVGLNVDFAHVLREKNKEADRMANIGIDQKVRVPNDFLKLLHSHALSL